MLEFWNEQNGCSWINPGCSNGNMASTYAPWLCRWYKAMKAVNASFVLSVGGLDYNKGVSQACGQATNLVAHCSAAATPSQLPDKSLLVPGISSGGSSRFNSGCACLAVMYSDPVSHPTRIDIIRCGCNVTLRIRMHPTLIAVSRYPCAGGSGLPVH